mgnify:CR=1 FL=1
MPEPSLFRATLVFFEEIGIYDVILPFLLIFTIVFAVLEKTKVLGYEDPEKKYPRRSLNSMVAFVVAFLVVASSRLVAVVNAVMAQVVLLLLLVVCFLILVGVLVGEGEFKFERSDPWYIFFTFFMFIGIVLIFANALGWLQPAWNYIVRNWTGNVVGSIILLIIVIGFMWLITKAPKPKEEKA